jgi:asparagine synthetase B (glutamine-hydrolysing)
MTDAVTYRGRDGAGTSVKGSVGLGHRMFSTTPQGLNEHQPLCDESGMVCLVLDGRVDNRDDLRKTLEAYGVARTVGSDD